MKNSGRNQSTGRGELMEEKSSVVDLKSLTGKIWGQKWWLEGNRQKVGEQRKGALNIKPLRSCWDGPGVGL